MFTGTAARAATEIIDQVVAIVDNDIIMASELRTRVEQVTENLTARGIDLPQEDTLIRETLDRLILESIQLQMGQRFGVRISDAQLNAAIGRIAGQNRMSLDEFRIALESRGQSYADMREQVRNELVLQRVQQGNVNQRIQISEQEVENFIATNEGQKLTQPEYHLLHALLPLTSDTPASDAAAAEAHVKKVLARIRSGADFSQVVSASAAPYNFSGGDLGWRSKEDLPSLFADVAPGMAAGDTAGPIRSESGLHIIHMAELRGGQQMVAQTEASHILVKPSEILSDDQARDLVAALRQRALDGEDFAALAQEYSEDIGSAQEGGKLGWTMTGQMVPEFEAAMAATAVGEISEPVRSQFGWHIVKVTGRRDHDMTEDAMRAKAMDYLHNRKYQEELDAWLRQIRDEAFVDIK
ncbi:MAG: molecular chaperone SurA [Halioglobus sp.]|nr:molecular chaperone SurA [Halioglobus sp.]